MIKITPTDATYVFEVKGDDKPFIAGSGDAIIDIGRVTGVERVEPFTYAGWFSVRITARYDTPETHKEITDVIQRHIDETKERRREKGNL